MALCVPFAAMDARSVTTTEQTSLDRFLLAHGSLARPPQSAVERRALLDGLEDPRAWPQAAAALLAELGFRLIEPAPGRDDGHLLIALRAQPTLRHFDPESIAFYAPAEAGAAPASIDRSSLGDVPAPSVRPALWGHVHVIDRLPVENRFLTFGGDLRAARVDSGLTVVDLWSPAPIVRWGGHSQSTDSIAGAIGAFFARLIVPIDFVPGVASMVDALLPEVIYRAFLVDALAREVGALRRGMPPKPLHSWLVSAWGRARVDEPLCRAARAFLVDVGLGTPIV